MGTEGVGALLQCVRCGVPFVVCEGCYRGQIYCSGCRKAARREQCREADREYLQDLWPRQLRAERSKRWRRKGKSPVQIDMDHRVTERAAGPMQGPCEGQAEDGEAHRGKEAPPHEKKLQVRDCHEQTRPEMAGGGVENVEGVPLRHGRARPTFPRPPEEEPCDGSQPPAALARCAFCGASVPWLVDREHLRRRKAIRRRPTLAIRGRRPRLPTSSA